MPFRILRGVRLKSFLGSVSREKQPLFGNGIVDYYIERQSDSSFHAGKSILDYFYPFSNPQLDERKKGNIFIIPAGKPDEDYLKKLARVDFQDIRQDSIKDTLAALVREVTSKLASMNFKTDYVLMDARAGFHDIGGVVLSQLPHGAVLFGRGDAQSWNGIKEAIRLAATAQTDRIPILLVDSMFHKTDSGRTRAQEQFKRDAFMYCRDYYYETDTLPGIDAENEAHSPVYIPYESAMNGEIRLLSDGSDEENERVAVLVELFTGSGYREIVQRIRGWFNDSDESVSD